MEEFLDFLKFPLHTHPTPLDYVFVITVRIGHLAKCSYERGMEMRRAGFVLLSLMAFIANSMASSPDARADLIVVDDGMSCTSEAGSFQLLESNPVVSPEQHDLMMLLLFNSANEAALGDRSTGGASAAGAGSSSVEQGPSPQVALFSRYEFHHSQMVLLHVSESSVFTPQSLICGIFRPPRMTRVV